ncbi:MULTISPECIES: hypothetical protein [Prevotellaceae]|uniref:hypothetical protein n=1 Tax=Prevotellaceae TaxID=171552 RepID=UPI0003D2C65B|nr:hypothetical protein [Prevotella phocaeensis]ETD16559.1 hypothetical protein HMPREF1199_02229 [Hoylesella oralis CC98A]
MKIANTRIVFDRHNTASKKIAVPVYVEVTFYKVRNFYNTGVKVKKGQFRNDRVCNCGQQVEYNSRIDIVRNTIVDYINTKLERNVVFTLAGLKEYMNNNSLASRKDAFLSFMYNRIYDRKISEGTRKGHLSAYHVLKRHRAGGQPAALLR